MKKIICLLLCLMMLIPVTVSQAYTTIDTVSITVTIPKAGTQVKDAVFSVPAGAPYSIEPRYWYIYNGSDWDQLSATDVFKAGTRYGVELDIYADYSTYMFNGDNTQFYSNVDIIGSYAEDNTAHMALIFTVPAESGSTEKVTLSKLKSVKLTALSAKKLKVTWKKLSSKDQKKIQKIQIQYSTDKTFKTGVKTKWAKKGASSAKISGLKKNTKYYIRIRAYKKSGGVIYVSKWVTKNKKTKKK